MEAMPSAEGAGSIEPSGTRPLRASIIACVCMAQGVWTRGSDWLRTQAGDQREPSATSRSRRQLHLINLLLQLDDAVDERFGARRAAGHVHIPRNDLIYPLHERVVVEHPANGRARAHRDGVFRLGHLVV